MTQPAPKPLMLNDVLQRIADECAKLGVDIDDLPRPQVYSWWHPHKADYQNFRHGDAHPWDDALAVVAMFRDDDQMRIYTIRVKEGPVREEPFKRFVLYTHNQSYAVEVLPLEGFIQAVADEWMVVAEGMTTADAERERTVEFLRKKGWPVAADGIEQLDHLEDEEDEPDATALPGGTSTASGSLS